MFLETKASGKIKERILKIVKNGFNLLVTGAAGVGKTALVENVSQELKAQGYSVLDFMASPNSDNRTNFYCKQILKELEPDSKVPGAIELKLKELRRVFLSSFAHKKKIVLIIDEAQNLNLPTLRGLKNLREMSRIVHDNKVFYQMSIILFCKNYRNFLDNFLNKDPGDRFLIEEMGTLDEAETIDLAKTVFNLKFENNQAKKEFCEITGGYPSAIEKIYYFLETSSNFDGVVTTASLISAQLLQAKNVLRQAGMNEADFADWLKKEKDLNVSASEVKRAMQGKETKNSEAIWNAMKKFGKTVGI